MIYRRESHADRARRVIARIGRGRWMSGREFAELATRLAHRYSDRPGSTVDALLYQSINWEISQVGLLDGRVFVFRDEPDYDQFRRALACLNKNQTAEAELRILNLFIKRSAQCKRIN